MKNSFLIADTHFGHANICKFLRKDGTPLRPWNDVQEMDEQLIQNWNAKVGQYDRIYLVGDAVIARKNLKIFNRLNGKKVLIKGNHDIFKLNDYLPYFEDIRAYHVLDNHLVCHIPVHPSSKGRFTANIHGHTHDNIVRDENNWPDPWYIPVSVEQIDYTPVAFEEIRKISSHE